MDIKTRAIAPSDAERAAVTSVLGPEVEASSHSSRGGHQHRERRHLLLPTLHAVNDRVGWISQPAIDYIAQRLDVSPAEIYGVATFYDLLATEERDARQVHVCIDLACRMAGRRSTSNDAVPAGAHPAPCLGMCEQAPAALVTVAGDPGRRFTIGRLTDARLDELLAGADHENRPTPASVPQAGDDGLVLLRRAGRGDPLDLDAYLADGGLVALDRARELGPEGIIAEVAASGLIGRGGAGFPTARKWEAVRSQEATPHHLVCNADESEPGTFKDRVLIEHDPYALLESMCIAALATGCAHGWIYLRGEYPHVETILHRAIDRFRAHGVLGSQTGFDITVFRGAGAYICGEETAIFNSIEGHRGEPRNKPPFPFQAGLFGVPTVVNNVETLMNVPVILSGRATGERRLFCLSGAVAIPGVYEVELGLTLGELIELAGGLRPGSELQAVLLGGAAGRFVGPEALDLVLDHDAVRAAGLSLGSGVVMVHDQHVDLLDQVRRVARFFRHESCGQCVPCRVGTVRQQEALDRLHRLSGGSDGEGEDDGDDGAVNREIDRAINREIALLADIGAAMTDASICGLGQTAYFAVESALVTLDVGRTRRRTSPGAAR